MEVPILKIPFDQSDADFISSNLTEMLLTGQLAMGRHTRAFEDGFAAFCNTPLAIGTSNGTTALELMCRALDLAGATVAVPANTFMATALAPIAAGARIILIDCDPVYFQMDPDDLAKKIRPDTRAVIVVHLGGFISPRWQELARLSEQAGAAFIEDAAHAHGAMDNGRLAGSLGRAAAFSFYPTKVLTTAEGGMVTTGDKDLYEKMMAIRQHGQKRPGSNIHEEFGLNYRPSEIHALLGLVMLKKANYILAERRRAAKIYDSLLAGSPISAVLAPEGQKPAYYKYMALLPEGTDRDRIKAQMKQEYKISLAGEVYAFAGHRQPIWKNHPEYLAQMPGDLPNTDLVARRQICLPIWPGLTEEAQNLVVRALFSVLEI